MTLLCWTFWLGLAGIVLLPFAVHYFDAANSGNAQPISAYLKAILLEWVCTLLEVVLWPLGLLPQRQRRYVAGGGPPVLLVPGLYLTRSSLWLLQWRLKQRGFLNVYPVDHRALMGSIEVMGGGVADQVRLISALSDGKQVFAIGHGIGGVVLRWCLQRNPELPIAKIITVGTPHGGTKLAVFGIGVAASQLRPGSGLLAELTSTPAVTVSSVYSRLDSHVIPSQSAVFGGHGVEFTASGPLTLLFGASVADWIAAELPRSP